MYVAADFPEPAQRWDLSIASSIKCTLLESGRAVVVHVSDNVALMAAVIFGRHRSTCVTEILFEL